MPTPTDADRRILVCDKCLRACCWYGEFMCDDAQAAGTGILTPSQLSELGREHPDNWSRAKFADIYGDPDISFSSAEPDLTPAYMRAVGKQAPLSVTSSRGRALLSGSA